MLHVVPQGIGQGDWKTILVGGVHCNDLVTPLVTGTSLHHSVTVITIIIITKLEKNGKIDGEQG